MATVREMTPFEKAFRQETKGMKGLSTGMAPCCVECQAAMGMTEEELGGNRSAVHAWPKHGPVPGRWTCAGIAFITSRTGTYRGSGASIFGVRREVPMCRH